MEYFLCICIPIAFILWCCLAISKKNSPSLHDRREQ